MKSLYAQYLEERTNDLIIEVVHGYVVYRYLDNDKTVYIVDIFVEPEYRQTHQASHLADLVIKEAKGRGAIKLLGSVMPSAKNSTKSMKFLIEYGFELESAFNDGILLKKEI